jgi:hypothetical protein
MSDRFRTPRSGLDQAGSLELADFAQLAQFPGWQKLRDHYESLTGTSRNGETPCSKGTPREFRSRLPGGLLEGVMAVLDTPSQAETRLTRELATRKDHA